LLLLLLLLNPANNGNSLLVWPLLSRQVLDTIIMILYVMIIVG